LVVGCFALGLLAAYLLLYRPQTQLLEKTSTDLESALLSRQIAETHAAITQLELDQAKSSADAANWRSGYLSVLAPINAARWALASGDKVETRTYLEAARQAFDTFLPQLTEKDPQAAEAIQARLELVENGVASDPDTALTDLTLLAGTLEKLAQ
jgi:hypothetical protein